MRHSKINLLDTALTSLCYEVYVSCRTVVMDWVGHDILHYIDTKDSCSVINQQVYQERIANHNTNRLA